MLEYNDYFNACRIRWIYGLVDPRNSEIFYIGHTGKIPYQRRLFEHIISGLYWGNYYYEWLEDECPEIPTEKYHKYSRLVEDWKESRICSIVWNSMCPKIQVLDSVVGNIKDAVCLETFWSQYMLDIGQTLLNKRIPGRNISHLSMDKQYLSSLQLIAPQSLDMHNHITEIVFNAFRTELSTCQK